MDSQSDYENQINTLVEQWDFRIAQLEAEARFAGPENTKRYEEEIGELIADREAVRRGLVKVESSGELCSSCPSEMIETSESSEAESSAEEPKDISWHSDFDVTRTPRSRYGREVP
ncbi:MAG TPA: hypothetical protein VK463_18085 [Desulfomonilaceae bacterium]|nr:hypothetical protein [Desulfomonilaceae bacterium]